MATERQVAVIQMLQDGASLAEIEAKLAPTGNHSAEVHTPDGTEIVYSGKSGSASLRNLIRSTRAVLNALATMGQAEPLPKREVVKLDPAEKKARAKERREAKKAAAAAEREELERLRAQVKKQK